MKIVSLRAYAATTLGSTALLGVHSEAATVVDVNSTTFVTGLSGIGTISLATADVYSSATATNKQHSYVTTTETVLAGSPVFSRGNDSTTITLTNYGRSFEYGVAGKGSSNNAFPGSSDNWMLVSSLDSSQSVWLQFYFGPSAGAGGFQILNAVYPDTPGELPSAASAAAALIPEPSALALMAMGATGVLARRRRSVA